MPEIGVRSVPFEQRAVFRQDPALRLGVAGAGGDAIGVEAGRRIAPSRVGEALVAAAEEEPASGVGAGVAGDGGADG